MTRYNFLKSTAMALTEPIKRGLEIGHIEVKVPPDKLLYHENSPIDLTGIKVVAYYTDGSPFGLIPIEELVPKPDPVEFIWSGSSCDTPSGPIIVNDKEFHGPFYVRRVSRILEKIVRIGSQLWDSLVPQYPLREPIQHAFCINRSSSNEYNLLFTHSASDENSRQKFLVIADNERFLICSQERFGRIYKGTTSQPDPESGIWQPNLIGYMPSYSASFTHNGQTVYYYRGFDLESHYPMTPISSQNTHGIEAEVAWYLWYGADVIKPWPQWETIEWTCPTNGKTFTTGYEITVIVS